MAFNHRFEHHCRNSTGADFEVSLNHVLQSSASTEMPAFAKGTLPKAFDATLVPTVAEARREAGDEAWRARFADSQERHVQMHGGKVTEFVEDDKADAKSVRKTAKTTGAATTTERKASAKKEPREKPVKLVLELSPTASNSPTKGAFYACVLCLGCAGGPTE